MTVNDDYRIVSPDKTVEALRDSGYNTPTNAVAELIDNSIEAGARQVDVLLMEASPDSGRRYARTAIERIAVMDDGLGMEPNILRRALKFGDGTKLNSRRGMGRFGVGLPNASISQARRVDVWTWQNGPANAVHTYLSLDEIAEGTQLVPEPDHSPVPSEYLEVSRIGEQRHGTLVVWSDLDRVTWKTARTIRKHAAAHVGQLYRKFLTRESGRISIVLIDCLDGSRQDEPFHVIPNDPLFLTTPSLMPAPFNSVSMFEPYGQPQPIEVSFTNERGEVVTDNVVVTCSHAKSIARLEDPAVLPWPRQYANAGASPWGKEAQKAQGVSLVRADREILTDTGWTISHDVTERWWSVEVAYPPSLDEVFGTVTNKQAATVFVRGSSWDEASERNEGESYPQYLDRLEEEGDRRVPLFPLWEHIRRQIRNMRTEQDRRMVGARRRRRHGGDNDSGPVTPSVEDIATAVVHEALTGGAEPGRATILGEQSTPEEREAAIVDSLTRVHRLPIEEAERNFGEITRLNRTVNFVTGQVPSGDFFFDVESLPNLLQVSINQANPAYDHILAVLEEVPDEASADELRNRLDMSSLAFKLLLFAWAQMEDRRSLRPTEQDRMRDLRNEWGRNARDCFRAQGDGDGL